MSKKSLVIGFLAFLCSFEIYAQDPNMRSPRREDHFWSRKIVNRVDLNEKINAPLIAREDRFYTDDNKDQFTEKEGLVMALFNGLKQGKFVAYHPDSLDIALSYEDVVKRIQKFEGAVEGDGDDLEEEEGGAFDEGFEEDFGEDFGDEGFEDFGGDEWGDESGEFGDDGFDDMGSDGASGDLAADAGVIDPGPFENVIHFVEDRIFDKTRSEMVYEIQWVELIWTDPGETLPDRQLCTFRYKDILETLENTQWKNRFNDAQYKTLKEIFDLRLFHSYIIDVSGQGVNSIQESEVRRQRLVEFEHHLWSY